MLGPAPGPSREESELCGKRGGGGTLDKTEFVRVLMRRVGRGDESTGSVQNFLRLDQSGLYAGAEVALDWIHLRSLQSAHLKTSLWCSCFPKSAWLGQSCDFFLTEQSIRYSRRLYY
jgi:hypothetical protein